MKIAKILIVVVSALIFVGITAGIIGTDTKAATPEYTVYDGEPEYFNYPGTYHPAQVKFTVNEAVSISNTEARDWGKYVSLKAILEGQNRLNGYGVYRGSRGMLFDENIGILVPGGYKLSTQQSDGLDYWCEIGDFGENDRPRNESPRAILKSLYATDPACKALIDTFPPDQGYGVTTNGNAYNFDDVKYIVQLHCVLDGRKQVLKFTAYDIIKYMSGNGQLWYSSSSHATDASKYLGGGEIKAVEVIHEAYSE